MFSQKIAEFKAAQIQAEDRQPNTHIRGGEDGECLGYTNRSTSIVGMEFMNNEETYRTYSQRAKDHIKELVLLKEAADRSDSFAYARGQIAQDMKEHWRLVYEAHARHLMPYLERSYDPVIDGGNIILELLRSSINSVDWDQLAERFLDAELEDYYGDDEVRQRKLEAQYSGS